MKYINLSIDYTIDKNGRILGASYNETGGFSGNLTYVYDNYKNEVAQEGDDGNIAKAIIIDPNNASITQYNPADIDDPYSCRARQCFIGIEMWPGQDNRVYLQGHVVIPNATTTLGLAVQGIWEKVKSWSNEKLKDKKKEIERNNSWLMDPKKRQAIYDAIEYCRDRCIRYDGYGEPIEKQSCLKESKLILNFHDR